MKKLTYKEAGVDIDEGMRFVEKIKPIIKSIHRPEVLTEIGGFSSLFSLGNDKYQDPVLVSSTDGIGTKLKIAFMMNRHDTIGIDLVAMNVNDLVVQGAEPLFFLDYLATGKLDPEKGLQIIRGIVEGCRQAGCTLIGGETAEMPSFYRKGEYDLAGFAVGVVERDKIVDGSSITVGNKIIGIASSGLHSNGFSLARKILLTRRKLKLSDHLPELGCPLGEELLSPTKIYTKGILNILKNFTVNGMAHITGGGIIKNLFRILPSRCRGVIYKKAWPRQPIFNLLQEAGNIEEGEMFRVFNNGIGMLLIVPAQEAEGICERFRGLNEQSYLIGEITERKQGEDAIHFLDRAA
jgi:phosphoribosylformylglycinamidine cyclo-ligase